MAVFNYTESNDMQNYFQTKSLIFSGPVVNIGSSQENELVLDSSAAPFHAMLMQQDGRWALLPLSDNTPILINNQPLSAKGTFLSGSETAQIGNSRLRFEFQQGGSIRVKIFEPGSAAAQENEKESAASRAKASSDQQSILAELTSVQNEINVGDTALYELNIINGGPLVANFSAHVSGVPEKWVTVYPEVINLNEKQHGTITVQITPPRSPSSLAGLYNIQITTLSSNYPNEQNIIPQMLTVLPFYEFLTGEISPRQQTVRWAGSHKANAVLPVQNLSNTPVDFDITMNDEANAAVYEFPLGNGKTFATKAQVHAGPGETARVPIQISPNRVPFIAFSSDSHNETASVQIPEQPTSPQITNGILKVRPFMGWWAILLTIICLAAAVVFIFQPRIYSFTVDNNHSVVELGQNVMLRWNVSPFATSIHLNISTKDGFVDMSRNQPRVSTQPTESTLYTLTASNFFSRLLNITYNRDLRIYVIPPTPEINVFEADKKSVKNDESVKLRWEIGDNVTSASLTNNGILLPIATEEYGKESTLQPAADTLLYITARNSTGYSLRSLFIDYKKPALKLEKYIIWVKPAQSGSLTSSVKVHGMPNAAQGSVIQVPNNYNSQTTGLNAPDAVSRTATPQPSVAVTPGPLGTPQVNQITHAPVTSPSLNPEDSGIFSQFSEKYAELVPDSSSETGYRVIYYSPNRELTAGEQIMVQWLVDGVSTVNVTPLSTDPLSADSAQYYFPTESMNFVLTAQQGDLKKTWLLPVTVAAGGKAEPPKIDFFVGNPTSVEGQGNTDLSWSVSGNWTRIQLFSSVSAADAQATLQATAKAATEAAGGTYTAPTNVPATGGLIADYIDATGSMTVNVTKNTTFTLKAMNGSLSASAKVDITVTAGKTAVNLTITKLDPDQSASLTDGLPTYYVNNGIDVYFDFKNLATDAKAPTGNVVISDGEVSCTATLPVKHCVLTPATTGKKTITAAYAGDTLYKPASSTWSQTINNGIVTQINVVAQKLDFKITNLVPDESANLTGGLPTYYLGSVIDVYFTISSATGDKIPTGTVVISAVPEDANSSETVTCTATLPTNHCSLTPVTTGKRTITAAYSGDTIYSKVNTSWNQTINGTTVEKILISENGSMTIKQILPDRSTNLDAEGHPKYILGESLDVYIEFPSQTTNTTQPTGIVTISDGLASCFIELPKNRSCKLTPATSGLKTITATYAGDNNYNPATATWSQTINGNAVNQINVVNPSLNFAITSLLPDRSAILSSAGLPTYYLNNSIDVYFSISSANGGTIPGGSVIISDGMASCTAALPTNHCAITPVTAGEKTITASYSGDSNYLKDSITWSQTIGGATVNQIFVTTIPFTITKLLPDRSANLSAEGYPEYYLGDTIDVYTDFPFPSSVSVQPSGTIYITDGETSCTATLPENYCSLKPVSTGAKTITATYSGDSNYSSVSATWSQTINGTKVNRIMVSSLKMTITKLDPDRSTTLTDGLPTYYLGDSLNVYIGFPSLTASDPQPTGNVTISDGTDSCTVDLKKADYCTLTPSSSGKKSLSAVYAGDSNYGTASTTWSTTINGNVITQINVINSELNFSITSLLPDRSATLTDGLPTYYLNNSIDVYFAISSAKAGTAPTGTVTISDGTASCTATLPKNDCTLKPETAGKKTITASYSGDTNYLKDSTAWSQTISGTTVNQVLVTTIPFKITALLPDNSAFLTNGMPTYVLGTSIEVYFSFPSLPSDADLPTGDVTISDGIASCTAKLPTNHCSLTPVSNGKKTITATYAGDTNYEHTSAVWSPDIYVTDSDFSITSLSPDRSANLTAAGYPKYFKGEGINVYVGFPSIPASSTQPTGNITITDGVATCSFSLPTKYCTLTPLTTGPKTITASYEGDTIYSHKNTSWSQTINGKTVDQIEVVEGNDPGCYLTTDPDEYYVGESVTITAKCDHVDSAVTDAGTITAYIGDVNQENMHCTIENYPQNTSCTIATNITKISGIDRSGTKTITGKFSSHVPTFANQNLTGDSIKLNKWDLTSLVISSPVTGGKFTSGGNFTLTPSWSTNINASLTPSGSFTVTNGTDTSTCSNTSHANGTAEDCAVTLTTGGIQSWKASYAGDDAFNSIESSEVTGVESFSSASGTASVSITSPASSANVFSENLITGYNPFSISLTGTGSVQPTGYVSLYLTNDKTRICTLKYNSSGSNICSLNIKSSDLDASKQVPLTLLYYGDSNYGKTEAAYTACFGTAVATTLSLSFTTSTGSTTAASTGEAVTYTASVTAKGSTPTGTITLTNGLTTQTLAYSGTAVNADFTFSTAGTKIVTATFTPTDSKAYLKSSASSTISISDTAISIKKTSVIEITSVTGMSLSSPSSQSKKYSATCGDSITISMKLYDQSDNKNIVGQSITAQYSFIKNGSQAVEKVGGYCSTVSSDGTTSCSISLNSVDSLLSDSKTYFQITASYSGSLIYNSASTTVGKIGDENENNYGSCPKEDSSSACTFVLTSPSVIGAAIYPEIRSLSYPDGTGYVISGNTGAFYLDYDKFFVANDYLANDSNIYYINAYDEMTGQYSDGVATDPHLIASINQHLISLISLNRDPETASEYHNVIVKVCSISKCIYGGTVLKSAEYNGGFYVYKPTVIISSWEAFPASYNSDCSVQDSSASASASSVRAKSTDYSATTVTTNGNGVYLSVTLKPANSSYLFPTLNGGTTAGTLTGQLCRADSPSTCTDVSDTTNVTSSSDGKTATGTVFIPNAGKSGTYFPVFHYRDTAHISSSDSYQFGPMDSPSASSSTEIAANKKIYIDSSFYLYPYDAGAVIYSSDTSYDYNWADGKLNSPGKLVFDAFSARPGQLQCKTPMNIAELPYNSSDDIQIQLRTWDLSTLASVEDETDVRKGQIYFSFTITPDKSPINASVENVKSEGNWKSKQNLTCNLYLPEDQKQNLDSYLSLTNDSNNTRAGDTVNFTVSLPANISPSNAAGTFYLISAGNTCSVTFNSTDRSQSCGITYSSAGDYSVALKYVPNNSNFNAYYNAEQATINVGAASLSLSSMDLMSANLIPNAETAAGTPETETPTITPAAETTGTETPTAENTAAATLTETSLPPTDIPTETGLPPTEIPTETSLPPTDIPTMTPTADISQASVPIQSTDHLITLLDNTQGVLCTSANPVCASSAFYSDAVFTFSDVLPFLKTGIVVSNPADLGTMTVHWPVEWAAAIRSAAAAGLGGSNPCQVAEDGSMTYTYVYNEAAGNYAMSCSFGLNGAISAADTLTVSGGSDKFTIGDLSLPLPGSLVKREVSLSPSLSLQMTSSSASEDAAPGGNISKLYRAPSGSDIAQYTLSGTASGMSAGRLPAETDQIEVSWVLLDQLVYANALPSCLVRDDATGWYKLGTLSTQGDGSWAASCTFQFPQTLSITAAGGPLTMALNSAAYSQQASIQTAAAPFTTEYMKISLDVPSQIRLNKNYTIQAHLTTPDGNPSPYASALLALSGKQNINVSWNDQYLLDCGGIMPFDENGNASCNFKFTQAAAPSTMTFAYDSSSLPGDLISIVFADSATFTLPEVTEPSASIESSLIHGDGVIPLPTDSSSSFTMLSPYQLQFKLRFDSGSEDAAEGLTLDSNGLVQDWGSPLQINWPLLSTGYVSGTCAAPGGTLALPFYQTGTNEFTASCDFTVTIGDISFAGFDQMNVLPAIPGVQMSAYTPQNPIQMPASSVKPASTVTISSVYENGHADVPLTEIITGTDARVDINFSGNESAFNSSLLSVYALVSGNQTPLTCQQNTGTGFTCSVPSACTDNAVSDFPEICSDEITIHASYAGDTINAAAPEVQSAYKVKRGTVSITIPDSGTLNDTNLTTVTQWQADGSGIPLDVTAADQSFSKFLIRETRSQTSGITYNSYPVMAAYSVSGNSALVDPTAFYMAVAYTAADGTNGEADFSPINAGAGSLIFNLNFGDPAAVTTLENAVSIDSIRIVYPGNTEVCSASQNYELQNMTFPIKIATAAEMQLSAAGSQIAFGGIITAEAAGFDFKIYCSQAGTPLNCYDNDPQILLAATQAASAAGENENTAAASLPENGCWGLYSTNGSQTPSIYGTNITSPKCYLVGMKDGQIWIAGN